MMEHTEQYPSHSGNVALDEGERPEFIDFSAHEVVSSIRDSKNFKLHAIVASIVSILCFLLWLFISFAKSHWPWYTHIWTLFCLTLSSHFYLFIRPRELLQLHFVWYLIINIQLLLIWTFAKSFGSPWFLYVVLGWGMILATHFIMERYGASPNKLIYLHVAYFLLINLICFLAWIDTEGFPWFIYPFYCLGLLLIVHWNIHYHPGDFFRLHLQVFLDIQLMLFFTWAAIGVDHFPWFFFVLIGWGALLAIHFWKHKPQSSGLNNSSINETRDYDPENQEYATTTGEPSLYPETSEHSETQEQ